jgi:RimJ/RimL family protein N-acetyltransferase
MIYGSKITLRGLEVNDVDELISYWNNIEFMNYSGRIFPQSREELVNWIQTGWKFRQEGSIFVFAIIENVNNQYIGNVELKMVNKISRRARVSIGIFNTNFLNKGLGTEALRLLVNYGFESLNLRSIELRVFENNKRAITSYEKLCFKLMGRRREADFVDGEYLDDFLMDILIEEWEEGRDNLKTHKGIGKETSEVIQGRKCHEE